MNLRRLLPLALPLVILVQIFTHLFWLTIAAQVGLVTIPWLMNRGYVIYDTVLEHRAPALAFIIAFFQRIIPIAPVTLLQWLNLALVILSSLLIYVLAYRLSDANKPLAAVIALIVWAWWEPSYGNILFYYDSVLGFLILLAIVVWVGLQKRPLWAALSAGLLLGISTIVKQHGWAAVGMFGLWLLIWGSVRTNRWRIIGVYIIGAMLLPLLVVMLQAAQGNLANYIYWTYTFNLSGSVPPLPPTSSFIYKMLLTHIFVMPFALLTWQHRREKPLYLLLLMMWVASGITLLPKFGEIHTMTMLPLVAVMSGLTVTILLRDFDMRQTSEQVLLGVMLLIGAGALWGGLVSYVPTVLGHGAVLAYDEFKPLAARLDELKSPGDTLFVLPGLDGNTQLNLMTDMLPPQTWTTTHDCVLCAPGLTERLLSGWDTAPPTYIIYFPDLITPYQASEPLVQYMEAYYTEIEFFGMIPFNGNAYIYKFDHSDG